MNGEPTGERSRKQGEVGARRSEIFDRYRPLLFSIAYRMLGSVMDAEDVVQEAYLRWQRASEVRSPRAYLSAVVSRLCIDQLRSARTQREQYVGPWLPEPLPTEPTFDVADAVALEESLSMAFLILLESLTPTERAVFLLREVFDFDYGEISHLVDKSEDNCRQIAHRARHLLRDPAQGPTRIRRSADFGQRTARSHRLLRRWKSPQRHDSRRRGGKHPGHPHRRQPREAPGRAAAAIKGGSGMNEILVTGGTGVLGRRVVDRLRAADHEVHVLSRSGRPGTIQGDLLTGAGLDEAVDGIKTIVHCASNPYHKAHRTDVGGTELLLQEAARAGVSHVVFISIVGVDRNPYYPYFRVKLDAESVVERSPVPWTILRATQFHDLMLRMLRLLDRLPAVMAIPRGLRFQPIDAGEVADRLVELALSPPAGRVPDVGGPEVLTSTELARAYLEATGRERRLVELPLPGRAARAWREGAQLCPDQTYGRIRWEDFLREEVQRQRVGDAGRAA